MTDLVCRFCGAGPREAQECEDVRCDLVPRGTLPALSDLDKAGERFAAWFRANYPGPDTIIHKPDWHAPRIFRAAIAALKGHP